MFRGCLESVQSFLTAFGACRKVFRHSPATTNIFMTLFRNYQAPLQILRKHSWNTLDTRNTLWKVWGKSLDIPVTIQTLFRHSFDTCENPWMHSQNIPRHSLETFLDALWEFCKYLLNALSKTLRQLSRHSGNFLETHLDTGNTLWKPSGCSGNIPETL